MSYLKKDEDADQAMIKLDRTTVFQEGKGKRTHPKKMMLDFVRSILTVLF